MKQTRNCSLIIYCGSAICDDFDCSNFLMEYCFLLFSQSDVSLLFYSYIADHPKSDEYFSDPRLSAYAVPYRAVFG